jgi:hypothetical protein
MWKEWLKATENKIKKIKLNQQCLNIGLDSLKEINDSAI